MLATDLKDWLQEPVQHSKTEWATLSHQMLLSPVEPWVIGMCARDRRKPVLLLMRCWCHGAQSKTKEVLQTHANAACHGVPAQAFPICSVEMSSEPSEELSSDSLAYAPSNLGFKLPNGSKWSISESRWIKCIKATATVYTVVSVSKDLQNLDRQ